MKLSSTLLNYRLFIIICLFVCVLSNAKKISFFEKLKTKNPEHYISFLKAISIISQVDFKFVPNNLFGNSILKIIFNKHVDVNNKNKFLLYELSKKHVLNMEWILDNRKELFNKVFSKIHSQGNHIII